MTIGIIIWHITFVNRLEKKRFNTYVVEQEKENILAVVLVDNKYMKEIYSLMMTMMMYKKYKVNEQDMVVVVVRMVNNNM